MRVNELHDLSVPEMSISPEMHSKPLASKHPDCGGTLIFGFCRMFVTMRPPDESKILSLNGEHSGPTRFQKPLRSQRGSTDIRKNRAGIPQASYKIQDHAATLGGRCCRKPVDQPQNTSSYSPLSSPGFTTSSRQRRPPLLDTDWLGAVGLNRQNLQLPVGS